MQIGTFIDFDIEANRRLFLTADQKVVYLGENGENPLGFAPHFFFAGDETQISTNRGTAGVFVNQVPFIACPVDGPYSDQTCLGPASPAPPSLAACMAADTNSGAAHVRRSAFPTPAFADTDLLTFSMWLKTDGSTTGLRPINHGNDGSFGSFLINMTDATVTNGFQVSGNTSGGGSTFNFTSLSGITDGSWHSVLISVDISGGSPVVRCYIDDVSVGTQTNTGDTGSYDLSILDIWTIGNTNDSAFDNIGGCIAQIWFDPTVALDFDIVAERRKFITATGQMEDVGATGQLPTGSTPPFYFTSGTGGPDFEVNRGNGGAFTTISAYQNCTDSPPVVTCPPSVIPPSPTPAPTPCPTPAPPTPAGAHNGQWFLSGDFPGGTNEFQRVNSFTLDTLGGVTWLSSVGSLDGFVVESTGGLFGAPPASGGSPIGEDAGGLVQFDTKVFFTTRTAANNLEVYADTSGGPSEGGSYSLDFTIDAGGNTDGPANAVFQNGTFDSFLYYGTHPSTGVAPAIWRRSTGGIGAGTWTNVHTFSTGDKRVSDFTLFGGLLYAIVEGESGTDAEIWRTADGSTWSQTHTFTGREGGSAIETFGANIYALVYEQGVATEAHSSSDGVVWTLSTTFTALDPTDVTTALADDGSNLFAGLGSTSFASPKAQVWAFNGTTWGLSVDFNATPFSLTFPSVTALAHNSNNSKIYAGLGFDASISADSSRIYVCPTADSGGGGEGEGEGPSPGGG